MNTTNYNEILKEGEVFYGGHTKLTLLDIKDSINVFEIGHRLPDVNWNSIKHCHATNGATIWALTERYFNFIYPQEEEHRPIGLDKPPLSFLKWIYEGLEKSSKK